MPCRRSRYNGHDVVKLPPHARYLVIGAGIHGLSTAYHLALRLRASGRGSGRDIVVVDKTGIAAGATGIAEFKINRKDFGIVYPGRADDLIADDVLLKLNLAYLDKRYAK